MSKSPKKPITYRRTEPSIRYKEQVRMKSELKKHIKARLQELYRTKTVYALNSKDVELHEAVCNATEMSIYSTIEDYLSSLGFTLNSDDVLSELLLTLDSAETTHGVILDSVKYKDLSERLNKYLIAENMTIANFQRIYKYKLYSGITTTALRGFTEDMAVDLLHEIYPQKTIEDATLINPVITRYLKHLLSPTRSFSLDKWLYAKGFKYPFERAIDSLIPDIDSISVHGIVLDVTPHGAKYQAIRERLPYEDKMIDAYLNRCGYARYSVLNITSLEGFTEDMVIDLLSEVFPNKRITGTHKIHHSIPRYLKTILAPNQNFALREWLEYRGFEMPRTRIVE